MNPRFEFAHYLRAAILSMVVTAALLAVPATPSNALETVPRAMLGFPAQPG